MSFRLAIGVVSMTGMFLASQTMTGGNGMVTSLTTPRHAGAKFMSVAPAEPATDVVAEPTLAQKLGWTHPLMRAALEKAGINVGPDPRVGTDLGALQARQRYEAGDLPIEEIGIDGFVGEIEARMDAAVFDQPTFDAYTAGRNTIGWGGEITWQSAPGRQ